MGKGYCKTNEICKILGGNCKITFISKERSPLIESLDKSVSVLLIEADSNEIVEEAYDRVMERMSGFLLSDEDVTRRPTAPKVIRFRCFAFKIISLNALTSIS